MTILEHHDLVAAQPRRLDRVVCGVDASRAGAEAVRHAIALAACAPRLRFVSVVGSGRAPSLDERTARQALGQAQAVALTRGIRAEIELVRADDPAAVLLASGGDDAILVAGTHGNSRLAGVATRSVATALAHRTAGPVLVARRCGANVELPRRILVAVDDDATAASAVRLAGTIAARCGGYVRLVHVRGHDYGSQTRHRLAVLSTELVELTGDEPGFDVLRGCNAAAQVSDLARRCGSTLVVVGRRGVTGVRALGSFSERLVHMAPCSVLVVPQR
jgi:nucleotide-binding universal stress UspA family protein